ncbi:MAG: transcriptional regulator with XRE-family HTH domain [Patescibacteria group bacterium]|jgi:transcriptional regulator with XRE-family HTH domain
MTRIYKHREKRIQELKQLQEQGLTLEQISTKTGLGKETLYKYGVNNGKTKPRKERMQEIIREIENGTSSLDKLAEKIRLKPLTIIKDYKTKLKEDGYTLPPLEKPLAQYLTSKNDPKRNRFIKRGLSLEHIAQKVGVTRERVRQYIVGKDVHKEWRTSRGHYKNQTHYTQKKEEKEKIVGSILEEIIQRKKAQFSPEEQFAYEGAEIIEKGKISTRTYTYDQVYSLLLDYHQTRERRENKSLTQLGTDHGIFFVTISKILQRLNLPTLGQSKPHKKQQLLTPEEKQRIENAKVLPYTATDLAYFIKVPVHTVRTKLQNQETRNPKDIVTYLPKSRTNYRTASQVYESQAAGFTPTETQELLDINPKTYKYITENKDWIQKDINQTLQIIYPEKEITKPWINFKN